MKLIIKTALITLLISFLAACNNIQDTPNVSDSDKLIYEKVDSILALMTIEEKAGQMLNIGIAALFEGKFFSNRDSMIFDETKIQRLLVDIPVGSVQNFDRYPLRPDEWRKAISKIQKICLEDTRLGIPMIYGIDAVHGANYTQGSVLFPHQINIAATFNDKNAQIAGKLTAYEIKASAQPWNYSPVLDVCRHVIWGRLYESFGEDPYLVSNMGVNMIKGMQGTNTADPTSAIACAKHYIGYGAAYNGKDRAPVFLPENYIREILLPPFEDAIDNGLLSIMISSSSLNGIPSHVDKYYLTDVLKEELGFKGVLLSDWADINYLCNVHKVAENERDAVKLTVNAGLDMCMDPYDDSFAIHLIDLVNSGEVPESRVNDAVRRILYMKYKAGLFSDPFFNQYDYTEFASAESDSINHAIACESITLLKNKDNVLPLSSDKKVLVTGVAANSINYLNGGWSRTWSGKETEFNDTSKFTILDAVTNIIGIKKVAFAQGTDYLKEVNINEAVSKAKNVDIIIACVGEQPATETTNNIENIDLPDVQNELVKKLAATGKPIILVMVQSRPRIIREIEPLSEAVVMAYLPGHEGGRAIADVLYGNYNPSGKLPFTYPRYSGSIWTYDHLNSDRRDLKFGHRGFTPQYEFGFGLSYSDFEYSNLTVNADSLSREEEINVRIDVKNTSDIAGREAVLLFIRDEIASVSPAVKKLRRYKKIALEPGESKQVEFTIDIKDLKFIGIDNSKIFEPGYFTFSVGSEHKTIYVF